MMVLTSNIIINLLQRLRDKIWIQLKGFKKGNTEEIF